MANDTSGIFSTIANLFKNVFTVPAPLKPINKETILAGVKFREGLSAIDIATRIIDRKKSIGIGIDNLPSGAQNIDLLMETIRVEEIINALLTNAKIEVSIPPGTRVITQGANAGGPMISIGTTSTISKGEGIIR
jgi:hypothetical protein